MTELINTVKLWIICGFAYVVYQGQAYKYNHYGKEVVSLLVSLLVC